MKRSYLIPILLSTCLALSACNMPGGPAQNTSVLSTAAALTVEAALSPQATQPLATSAVSVTQTPVACEDIAQIALWTRDNITFDVNEVNHLLAPGKVFTMTWTLKNTGTCTWNSNYQFYFDSGTPLTTAQQFPVIPSGETVAPGGSITVNIPMTAPDKAGEYQSGFHLQNDRGEAVINMGVPTKVGSSSSQPLASPGDLRYTYDCTSGSVNITLFWVDRASVEDGYRIFRGEIKLADIPAGSTTYSDIAPGSGEYSYTVAAYSENGESRSRVRVDTKNCK